MSARAPHAADRSVLAPADLAGLVVRPIEPRDRDRLAAAFARLSLASRQARFFFPKKQLSPAELDYLTDVDHRGHEALVAIDAASDRIVAVARYAMAAETEGTADVAFTVADAWQRRGLGRALGARLVARAAVNGLTALTAVTQTDNDACRKLLRALGFRAGPASLGLAPFELSLS